MKAQDIFDSVYTASMLVIAIITLIILGFLYTANAITNEAYFIAYISLGVITVTLSGIIVFYQIFDRIRNSQIEKSLASSLFFSDTSKQRILSNPLSRIGAVIIVLLVLTISTFGLGQVVNVPNPYSGESLTKSVLESNPIILNLFGVGWVPGFFEELGPHVLASMIVLILTVLLPFVFIRDENKRREIRSNTLIFLVAAFIGVVFASALFTYAHNLAYGLNGTAYLQAFIFEATVQFLNQVTGLFISWLPHIMHNSIVVFLKTQSFAIGGTFAAGLVFFNRTMSASLQHLYFDTRRTLITDYKRARRVFA